MSVHESYIGISFGARELHRARREEQVKEYFRAFGDVTEVVIMKDKITR